MELGKRKKKEKRKPILQERPDGSAGPRQNGVGAGIGEESQIQSHPSRSSCRMEQRREAFVLENDADVDTDIGKGVLEVLGFLCEGPEGADGVSGREKEKEKERDRDISLITAKNTAFLLSTPRVVHKLFALLVPAESNYLIRYLTLRLLSILISAKKHVVQAYFLSAPNGEGPRGLLGALEEKREVARNGE